MKKIFLLITLLFIVTACSSLSYEPIATHITININPDKTDFAALDSKTKVQDCNWGFLDVSVNHRIKDLMRNNNLSKIYWVEYEEGQILFWKKHCIVLYAD
ncbi:MAG: membrane lipoprotein lipid attachment site-containing protein [Alphaproteobacteria bacterium]